MDNEDRVKEIALKIADLLGKEVKPDEHIDALIFVCQEHDDETVSSSLTSNRCTPCMADILQVVIRVNGIPHDNPHSHVNSDPSIN